MMGQETLHPLVSVVDFSKCKPMLHSLQRFGFYAVFLKDVKCGDIRYIGIYCQVSKSRS